jgi:hypothetical protein
MTVEINAEDLRIGDITVACNERPMTGSVISVDFMERTMFRPPSVDVRFRLDDGRQFIKPANHRIEIKTRTEAVR